MRIDWAMLLTIFLAVLAADIFHDALFSHGSNEASTQVSAQTSSPAAPVVVYANPIEEFIASNYPNARR